MTVIQFAPGLRPVLKHLKGQHDQQTHARGGSSLPDGWSQSNNGFQRVLLGPNNTSITIDLTYGEPDEASLDLAVRTVNDLQNNFPVRNLKLVVSDKPFEEYEQANLIDKDALGFVMPTSELQETIHLRPAMLSQAGMEPMKVRSDDPNFFMASANDTPSIQYIVTHEYGHVRDRRGSRINSDAYELYRKGIVDISKYGSSNEAERWAESFTEYVLTNGKTTNATVQYFADKYFWAEGLTKSVAEFEQSANILIVDTFSDKKPPFIVETVLKHGDHNQLMHGNRSRGGIDRADMPQIPRRFREKFLDELSAEGVSHTDVDVDPRSLRRTQRGLNPDNVRSMYDAMKQPDFDDKGQRIIVSRDNKVLDGHHRWAAAAQIAQERPGFTIGVTRIDMPMSELLGRAARFNEENSIESRSMEDVGPRSVAKHLQGQHDQQTHGKGGSSSTTPQRTKMGRIPWGTINNGEDFMTVLADDYKSAKGNPSADASDFKALVAERVAARLSDLTPEEIYEAGRVTFVRNPGEIDEQGAREHAVSGLVAKFAETANDSSPVSLAVQRAAEVEFGMKAADEWVGNESAQTEAAAHYAKHEKVLRRYVRAQYEETQSVLRDAGVEELEVYRGVMMPDIGPPSGGERTEAVLRPLSSWTTHSPVAVDFVTSYAMNSGRPTLLSARVPASRVFSLPTTGVGCLKEFEVVLLGSEPLEVTSQTYSGVNPFSKHLQGQHDQQSHGKGRSKEALSAITAASEKQAKVGRVLDDSVIPVDGRSRSLAMVGPLQHLEVDGKPQYLEKINAQGAAAIITEQGWDAPAQKVDKETFEALATQGDFVRVYRGGPRGLEEGMINGTPYIGDGIFGPGTYVSTDRSIAQMYVLGGVGEGSLVPMLMPRSMATPTARPAGGYDPLSEYAMQGSGAVLFPQGRDYLVWNTGALIVGPPETDQVVKQFGETGNYYKVVQGRAVPLRISNGAVIDPGLDVSKHLSGQHDQKTHGKGGAAGRTIDNGDDFKIMLTDDYISARGDRPTGDYAPAYKALVSERLAARMSDIPTYDLIKATNQGQIESENVEEFWQRANDPANVIHYREGNLFIGPKAYNPYLSGPSGGTLEAETILRTYAAQRLVNQWALSSNDADVVSLSVQKAAEAEFGITGSKRPSEYRDGNRTDSNLDAAVDIHYTKHEKALRAFVRAQYDETQAMFARAGVTDIVVYRGRNEPESVAQSIPQGGTQVTARLRPMSSWSTDLGVAERFAGQTVDPGRNGVIMTAKVPVKQVLSTPSTGNGCLDEYEVVILGPSIDANMTFFDQFAYEYYND